MEIMQEDEELELAAESAEPHGQAEAKRYQQYKRHRRGRDRQKHNEA